MTLWVRCKKPVRLAVKLESEDVEGAQDMGGNSGDNYVRVEMPVKSLMTKCFEGRCTNELIQRMFAHIKTQAENPVMPESDIMLGQIMHFHKLALA